MRELYALEVSALARELDASLSGFRIEKFYETAPAVFRMRLSRPGAKANVRCAIPYTINATEYMEQAGPATSFSMAVRKRAEGFSIESVSQCNNDRIIIFSLAKGDERSNMIFEMFGRGNMVMTDAGMTITLAYQLHRFKDREIFPKSKYVPPKNDAAMPIDEGAVLSIVQNLSESAHGAPSAQALHRRISMGLPYIENALDEAGAGKGAENGAPGQASPAAIARAISSEASSRISSPSPVVYMKDGAISEFGIGPLSRCRGMEERSFQSVQAMLDEVYHATMPAAVQANPEAETLRASMEKQQRLVADLEGEAKASTRIGEAIFRHMGEINAVISAARENRRSTKEELQKHAGSLRIIAVDLKSKRVTIEIKG